MPQTPDGDPYRVDSPHDLDLVSAFLAPHHHTLAAEVSAFAASEIATLEEPAGDAAARSQAREILGRLARSGLTTWSVPEAATGPGGEATPSDLRACCLIREALAAASPLADDIFAIQCLASMPIVLAGTPHQRAEHLPTVRRGEAMMAFAMTEVEAGSDVAAMRTRATRHDGGWVLEGEKSFISNAGIADLYVVFASVDPEAGHRGLACFLVEASRPGIELTAAQELSAAHPLGTIALRDCHLDGGALIGGLGEGFSLGMRTLDRLRVTVAAAACGMAARALAEALAHAGSRRQFGRPLGSFQLVQAKLARMATSLAAARLLTYRAAARADGAPIEARVTLPSAMAKLYATEAAQTIVDDAVQILGGRGTLRSHPVDRLYRSVRALRIYEGTSEIQHLVIARELQRGTSGESSP